ncbi:MAG: hypothetical protein R3A10_06345 [Caldilineaceae bacterium]
MRRDAGLNPVMQRNGLRRRVDCQFLGQNLTADLELAQRFSPAVGDGQQPHHVTVARFARRLQFKLTLRSADAQLVTTGRQRMRGQCLKPAHADAMPLRPLHRQPRVEVQGVGNVKVVKKLATDEGQNLGQGIKIGLSVPPI